MLYCGSGSPDMADAKEDLERKISILEDALKQNVTMLKIAEARVHQTDELVHTIFSDTTLARLCNCSDFQIKQ